MSITSDITGYTLQSGMRVYVDYDKSRHSWRYRILDKTMIEIIASESNFATHREALDCGIAHRKELADGREAE